MSVSKRVVKGDPNPRWVIDRALIGPDGKITRYRRVAEDQSSKKAAAAEEQRIVLYWETHHCLPGDRPLAPQPSAEKPSPTWDDCIDHYKSTALELVKPTTKSGYLKVLEGPWFRHWVGKTLDSIDYRAVEVWDVKMLKAGISSSTRRNHHIVLRAALKSVGPKGGRPGLLISKVPELPPLPRVGRTAVEAVSEEELERLLEHCTHPGLRVAIALAAYAGLRRGEISALLVSDLDFKARTITISKSEGAGEVTGTKSGHSRVVPIKAALYEILEAYQGERLVTTNLAGNAWGDGLTTTYRNLAKRLGLRSTKFHALRHRFATQLFLKAKADAVTVQRLLGHENLSVTQRYAHHDRQKAEEAVALL